MMTEAGKGTDMVILVKISNAGKGTEVSFPCREPELKWRLEKIGAYGGQDSPCLYLDEVLAPEALSGLQGAYVNLDELNCLARRLAMLDQKERRSFAAAMEAKGFRNLKGLINLSFNLARYTLVRDVSSLAEVGRAHRLHVDGGMPLKEYENEAQMAEEGRALLEKGGGIPTSYGLVFENGDVPFQEVYQGETFPDCGNPGTALVRAEVRSGENLEALYLPEDGLALKKALGRLGAECFSQCSICLEEECLDEEGLLGRVQEILDTEGIYEANRVLAAFHDCAGGEWGRLSALFAYAGVREPDNLVLLARNLEQFGFVPGISTPEEVGHFFLERTEEFFLSPVLSPFLDFVRLGEALIQEKEGKFVPGGFVYYSGYWQAEDVLGQLGEEGGTVTLGGMQ